MQVNLSNPREVEVTAENPVFVPSVEDVLENSRGSDYITIGSRVFGYWSNPNTLHIQRNWRVDTGVWQATVSHSSGGRDASECNDLDAELNFAEATKRMVWLARELLTPQNVEKLEAAYQVVQAEIKAIEAAKQAKRDADAALKPEKIKAIVAYMKATDCHLRVFTRGSDSTLGDVLFTSRAGKLFAEEITTQPTIRQVRNAIKFTDLPKVLSDKSNRTEFYTPEKKVEAEAA